MNILCWQNCLIVMIFGSIEDGCFSTLSFLKSMLHNKLIKHLDLVVNMFAKDHYFFIVFL
jgi:hypothetical protein